VSDQDGVPRNSVVTVLRAYAVSAVVSGDKVTISRGSVDPPLVFEFPSVIHRRTLQRLSVKFGIPIHLFWHPEQIPKT
jgi:hypothetical protein